MKFRRLMVAAPKSGSGKTMVTCGLLQSLKDQGIPVASYKCGPDYIDPMFHETAIGVPARNLDTFFTGERQTRQIFFQSAPEEGISVMEGVMGLYDGLGGIREEGSSYHLAKVTKTPIILTADVRGMGISMLPMLAGFLSYDKEGLIQGIILNRISKGYFERMKPLLEKELKVPVLGFLPEQKELQIGSRHLGLVLPGDMEHTKRRLQAISEVFMETVSLDAIKKIAEGAAEPKELQIGKSKAEKAIGKTEAGEWQAGKGRAAIAVAKDEAFCFYYADNLRLLVEYGAELKYFSPLHDEELPEGCQGLLLGGGYPELYAKRLSENILMRKSIQQAAGRGMPMVAECGGFMYLHKMIKDKDGAAYDMVGVIPEACFYAGQLVRFGYVEMQEKESIFLPKGQRIKGHEFHYYDSTGNGEDAWAAKPVSGKTYPCVVEGENYWLGFPHLYYPSNPSFAKNFVAKAEKFQPY